MHRKLKMLFTKMKTTMTPKSFYNSAAYLIVLYVSLKASFDLCSSPFDSSLFSSEANISATSTQDSLNDLILDHLSLCTSATENLDTIFLGSQIHNLLNLFGFDCCCVGEHDHFLSECSSLNDE